MVLSKYEYKFYYITTNLVNGKIYVGSHCTNNIDDGYLGSGYLLKKAIKKYGRENFKREILEFYYGGNRMEFYKIEDEFIENFNAKNRKIGYNRAEKSGGGDLLTDHPNLKEIKKKISIAGKGRIISEEIKEKIGKSNVGKKRSEKTKEKLRIINKGKVPYNKGISPSEKTIKKISNTLKGKYVGNLNPNYENYWNKEQKENLSNKLKESGHNKKGNNCKARKVLLFDLLNDKTFKLNYIGQVKDYFPNIKSYGVLKCIVKFQYYMVYGELYNNNLQYIIENFANKNTKKIYKLICVYKRGVKNKIELSKISGLKLQYISRFLKNIRDERNIENN